MDFILREYSNYAKFTNLVLNLKKSYVVPLFMPDIAQAKDYIIGCVPGAASICFAFFAVYLEVYLGPGAEEVGWEAPLLKYLDRARLWGGSDGGLF